MQSTAYVIHSLLKALALCERRKKVARKVAVHSLTLYVVNDNDII